MSEKNTVPQESLFSPKNRKLITDPIGKDNPITVQVLGICSVLAVTVQLRASLVLAIAVVAVMGFANVIISLLRHGIPPRIRIIVQLTVIASLVILVDQILKLSFTMLAVSYQYSLD
jgi:Na+-transporting NADH:ubiquinone oxidoreductase subunit D